MTEAETYWEEKVNELIRDITRAGFMPKSEARERVNSLINRAREEGYVNRGVVESQVKEGIAQAERQRVLRIIETDLIDFRKQYAKTQLGKIVKALETLKDKI